MSSDASNIEVASRLYGYIYCLTNLVNNKVYIGQTTLPTIQHRYKIHVYEATRQGSALPLHKAIRKYGADGFKIEQLALCQSQAELDSEEIKFIAIYDSIIDHDKGYNCTFGGGSGKLSDATKAKLSAAHKGKTLSPEHKANMTAAQTLRHKNYSLPDESRAKLGAKHKGKVMSPEARKKMSLSHLGKPLSLETRAKMSASQKVRKHKPCSEETKERLRSARVGIVPWNKGLKATPEQRAKLSEAHYKYYANKAANVRK